MLTDIGILLRFEKGIRGGIIQAIKSYAKVNIKYMKDQYNLDKSRAYLQYLDANNLYSQVMIKKLPTHGFPWEKKVGDFTPEKIDKLVKKTINGMF